ncbi:MAG: hypothetical protein J4F41_07280 [Alphaproteobacteria bacterium]|nr:hypothetical protein [Alphaproteobacteria bacterium]
MITRLRSLIQRYPSFDRYVWLNSIRDWRFVAGAAVLILLAGLINYDTRQSQWETWTANPDIYFVDGSPQVSTTDAGHFLSYARDYRNGTSKNGFNENRFYPDNTETYKSATEPDYVKPGDHDVGAGDVPLLSVIIATTADMFFDGDLLTAGNMMLPITGLLTAMAVAGMFWAAGYPAEGAIAGTGFGLSATYLIRTSIGRIDTDQLVVFFLALSVSFILLAARERNISRQLGFVLLAALAAISLEWWYPQPLFLVLLPLLAGFAIFTHQQDVKRALGATAAFILATNPVVVIPAFWSFFEQVLSRVFGITLSSSTGDIPSSPLNFPDTFTTVTELGRIGVMETLRYVSSDITIGAIGCLGFVVFLIVKPSRGLVFLPFFLIGLMSITLGRRFAFYGAPFIWFGLAWAGLSLVRLVAGAMDKSDNPKSFVTGGAVLTAAAAGVILTAANSILDYVPRPSFPSPIVKTFSDMKKLDQGQGGIVATWWDYGYLMHFKSGLASLHDGGTQTTPRTFLVARGVVSPNPAELIQTVKFIASEGSDGLVNNYSSAQQLVQAITTAEMPDKPLYLLFSDQMAGWFTTMSKLGLHNVVSGQAPSPSTLNAYGYRPLNCSYAAPNKFNCRNGLLDITHGTLDGKPLIRKTVETVNGRVTNFKDYDNNGLFVLNIGRLDNGQTRLTLVPQPTWNSSFNMLFELAVYDETRLELVIDNYPHARVYKVLQ